MCIRKKKMKSTRTRRQSQERNEEVEYWFRNAFGSNNEEETNSNGNGTEKNVVDELHEKNENINSPDDKEEGSTESEPVRPLIDGCCRGCGQPVGNVHKCDICGSNMHVFCGLPIGEEGYGQKICCPPCQSLSSS